jgi:hypothetical protein
MRLPQGARRFQSRQPLISLMRSFACVFFIIPVVCYPVYKHVNQTVAEGRLHVRKRQHWMVGRVCVFLVVCDEASLSRSSPDRVRRSSSLLTRVLRSEACLWLTIGRTDRSESVCESLAYQYANIRRVQLHGV